MAAAGPAVSLALAAGFAGLALAVPAGVAAGPHAVLAYLAVLNGALAVFNLLPALPMDGGRIAHAALWRRLGDRDRATLIAARGPRLRLVVRGARGRQLGLRDGARPVAGADRHVRPRRGEGGVPARARPPGLRRRAPPS